MQLADLPVRYHRLEDTFVLGRRYSTGTERAGAQLEAAALHVVCEALTTRYRAIEQDIASAGVPEYLGDPGKFEERMLKWMRWRWLWWVRYFIHLFPHDVHAELTHDDFEWGAGLPKHMLVKEKHLAMLPVWTWNGLDPPQQQALREVWCRNRHFAEVTAAGQLVMRVGRREVIA